MMAGVDTWNAGETSSGRSSRALASHDKLWEQMIQSIREEDHHDFISMAEMSRILRTVSNALWNSETKQQFVVFQKFKQPFLAEFDSNVEGRRQYKVSYMNDTLIVKFMPSVKHEEGGRMFESILNDKLRVMGMRRALRFTGAARVSSLVGDGSKEPDHSYVPRTRLDNVPSVVVEVGVSESIVRLRQDAEWWLTHMNGRTKLLFLIFIDTNTQDIHLETWVRNSHALPTPQVSRIAREERYQSCLQRENTNISTILKSYEIDITRVAQVGPVQRQVSRHDNLVIPWQLFWDDYPGPAGTLQQDIIFIEQDFIEFAEAIW